MWIILTGNSLTTEQEKNINYRALNKPINPNQRELSTRTFANKTPKSAANHSHYQ
jgi:hypothetical protein